MAPHSSTLAWKIPWTEEPGGLQSMGSLGVGHDWATSLSLFTLMHWRRKWQPTPVSCLENPRDGGAWWAAVSGVAQSWTRLKWLSSSSSILYSIVVESYYIFPSVSIFLHADQHLLFSVFSSFEVVILMSMKWFLSLLNTTGELGNLPFYLLHNTYQWTSIEKLYSRSPQVTKQFIRSIRVIKKGPVRNPYIHAYIPTLIPLVQSLNFHFSPYGGEVSSKHGGHDPHLATRGNMPLKQGWHVGVKIPSSL